MEQTAAGRRNYISSLNADIANILFCFSIYYFLVWCDRNIVKLLEKLYFKITVFQYNFSLIFHYFFFQIPVP